MTSFGQIPSCSSFFPPLCRLRAWTDLISSLFQTYGLCYNTLLQWTPSPKSCLSNDLSKNFLPFLCRAKDHRDNCIQCLWSAVENQEKVISNKITPLSLCHLWCVNKWFWSKEIQCKWLPLPLFWIYNILLGHLKSPSPLKWFHVNFHFLMCNTNDGTYGAF